MPIYLMISLPRIPYIHRIPYMYGSGQPYVWAIVPSSTPMLKESFTLLFLLGSMFALFVSASTTQNCVCRFWGSRGHGCCQWCGPKPTKHEEIQGQPKGKRCQITPIVSRHHSILHNWQVWRIITFDQYSRHLNSFWFWCKVQRTLCFNKNATMHARSLMRA